MSTLDNAIQNTFSESVKIRKVWTNASPTSTFVAQKININMSQYMCAVIVSVYHGDYEEGAVNMVFRAKSAQMNYAGSYNMPRTATLSDTGVTFSVGRLVNPYGTVVTDNNRNIPIEIYGIEVMPSKEA